jgi:hypothetical protein
MRSSFTWDLGISMYFLSNSPVEWDLIENKALSSILEHRQFVCTMLTNKITHLDTLV